MSLTDTQIAALVADGWHVSACYYADRDTLIYTLEKPERILQLREPDAAQQARAAMARRTAAGWVQLRMIRDRWLAQTDYIEVYLSGGFSPLPAGIEDALTANSQGWLDWRQALRDLPATPGTPGLDPVAAVEAIESVHRTTDTFPAPWPQPPASPVIHLT